MDFWQKIKSTFNSSVETISDKTSEWSQLAKLKWEHHNIQRSIDKKLNELGGLAYQIHVEQREDQLTNEAKELVQKLKTLEQELRNKQNEITELMERGVDAEQLKKFRKDLELGDGKIEQIVIDQKSDVVGKKLMEISLPQNVLIGAIVRNKRVVIPDGQTVIEINDKLTLIGEKDDVDQASLQIEKQKDSSPENK